MMLFASLAWRSKRNRATPSTASRMTLNNKIEAGIPTANTTQGSTVQKRARRVSLSLAIVMISFVVRNAAPAQWGIMQQPDNIRSLVTHSLALAVKAEKAGLLRPLHHELSRLTIKRPQEG